MSNVFAEVSILYTAKKSFENCSLIIPTTSSAIYSLLFLINWQASWNLLSTGVDRANLLGELSKDRVTLFE